MARHKFKLGQLVDVISPCSGVPTAERQHESVRLLPVADGNGLYRIKSKGQSFARVAKENRALAPPAHLRDACYHWGRRHKETRGTTDGAEKA